ncbi:MAG: hypothetical protein P8186_08815 [Anaerolineae bacterium]
MAEEENFVEDDEEEDVEDTEEKEEEENTVYNGDRAGRLDNKLVRQACHCNTENQHCHCPDADENLFV